MSFWFIRICSICNSGQGKETQKNASVKMEALILYLRLFFNLKGWIEDWFTECFCAREVISLVKYSFNS